MTLPDNVPTPQQTGAGSTVPPLAAAGSRRRGESAPFQRAKWSIHYCFPWQQSADHAMRAQGTVLAQVEAGAASAGNGAARGACWPIKHVRFSQTTNLTSALSLPPRYFPPSRQNPPLAQPRHWAGTPAAKPLQTHEYGEERIPTGRSKTLPNSRGTASSFETDSVPNFQTSTFPHHRHFCCLQLICGVYFFCRYECLCEGHRFAWSAC